jgi:hypothetical protein
MQIHPIGKAVAIGDVPAGGCFAFRKRDTTYVAINLTNGQTVAVLWPHHPNVAEVRAGLWAVSSLTHSPMWLLPDPIVCADTKLESVRERGEIRDGIGMLVLAGGVPHVAIHRHGIEGIGWVNLITGDLVNSVPDPQVWFTSWSIAIVGPDGQQISLCTIPAPTNALARAAPSGP